eukprot:scaffold135083_cov18-Tisochrysis_lutea.AAC.2
MITLCYPLQRRSSHLHSPPQNAAPISCRPSSFPHHPWLQHSYPCHHLRRPCHPLFPCPCCPLHPPCLCLCP